MILLTRDYDLQMKNNFFFFVSASIVIIGMYFVLQNAHHLSITPLPQIHKKNISPEIMVTLASLPVRSKIQKKITKPIVKPIKKKVVKKITRRKKRVLKKVAPLALPVKESPKVIQESVSEVVTPPTPVVETITKQAQKEVMKPATTFDAEMKAEFIAGLYKILNQNKHYPKMAKRRHLEGIAKIHFRLGKDGKIHNVFVGKSCGHKMLDKAALALIKKIRRYKPIPDKVSMAALDLNIPITYSIHKGN